MSFLKYFKPEIKTLLVVGVVAGVVTLGGIWLAQIQVVSNQVTPAPLQPAPSPEPLQKAETQEDDAVPAFEDFLLGPGRFEGVPAEPDFSTNPDAPYFITRITEGAKEGPNFAAHYTIVQWGCGSACQTGAIVDATDGSIYYPIPTSFHGKDFRIDSSLLIVNIPGVVREDLYQGAGATKYYVWEGEELTLISGKEEADTKPT